MLKFRNNGGQGLSLSLLHLYSTSSSSTEPTLSFVNYLVDSLGFSNQQALSCSAKLYSWRPIGQGTKKVCDFDSISKADSIITFLKQIGFDKSHIRNIVCYDPRILRSKIDKTLKPKIEFLQDQGLSGPDLVQFVFKNPVVLIQSLNSSTLPAIQALREVLGNDDNVIAPIKRMDYNLLNGLAKHLLPNVALLQTYGIPLESIRKRLIQQPSSFVRNTKSFEDLLIRVEERLGIPRDSSMFLYGVQLLVCFREETIVSKCEVFRSFGWTESDIRETIRRNPNCLTLSEARIKKSLEFLVNELGYKPDFIKSHHALLICSLEKRIIPRHRVLLVLKDKGLLRRDCSLYSVAIFSEAVFVKRFVLPFKEVHEVYAECTGCPVQLLTLAKEDSQVSSPKLKS